MLNFVYYAPTKVIFGKNTQKQIGVEIKNRGFKKVLLHYGGGSIKQSGVYDDVVASLKEHAIEFVELSGVKPNPDIALVREGAKLCKAEGVDFILAVGGGSVIDSSKAIALMTPSEYDHWDFVTKKAVPEKAIPIGVVLTIAAAGSEMSSSVVITNTDENKNIKRGLNSDLIRPVFAVMNPEYTFSVSKFQTACGVVDIMMHTLERYISATRDASITDRIAEGLLKSVIEAGKDIVENPDSYEARANLMWASSLSHNGLTGCGREFLLSGHQIGHELSGMFDIAHGASLSMAYPALCRYVYEKAVDKFAQVAVNVWGVLMDFENPKKTALNGIIAMENYFKYLEMPTTLRELNVPKEAFNDMAERCTHFGKRTLPLFIDLGNQDIINILELAY